MSICVLIKVGEGLVFATDSASTVGGAPVLPNGSRGPQGVIKIFYTGKKLLQLGELPVGIMTWGAGSFKDRTIASLVEEFESTKEITLINSKEEVDIKEIANKLWNFVLEKSDKFFNNTPKKARPKTGLVIGGYSGDNFFPEEYAMTVPVKETFRIRPDKEDGGPNFGANWYGMTDAITRFHHGRDGRIFNILKKYGMEEEKIKEINKEIGKVVQYPILFNAMPLKDAIEYARFLVELTIARFRFVAGAEICGGDIHIATITRKSGFLEIQP